MKIRSVLVMFVVALVTTGWAAAVLAAEGDAAPAPELAPPTAEPDVVLPPAPPNPPATPTQPPAATEPPAPTPPPCPPCPPAPKPAPNPYKGVFYDNDFTYLEGSDGCPEYLSDVLKRRSVGNCLTVDAGGEYRLRHENQHILSRTNDVLLHRTRLYTNLEYGSWFRAYAEGIDATTDLDDVAPRAIDVNRFDALNLFGEAKLFDRGGGDVYFRAGRQELLYGAQRFVSPLDWSNTRRTFDGFKAFWKGTDWDVDVWWTRPVPFGQHTAGGWDDHNFDHPDQSQEFIGFWATHKACQNRKLDFYFLRLEENDPGVTLFEYNTLGARCEGSADVWLWEIEAAYQYGDHGVGSHSAGAYTAGLGRKLGGLPMDPVLWFYYDWASGDRDPTDSKHSTFNQLFPLGHKYFGFMDVVGRQNIEDFNIRLTATPHKKVKLLVWWHMFHLQQARDSLYSAGGGIVRTDAGGTAGTDVGQELDVVLTFLLCPRSNIAIGYSHLYSGDFIRDTPGGISGEDFYYGQYTVRF